MANALAEFYAYIGSPFVNEGVAYHQLESSKEKYAQSKLSGYLAIVDLSQDMQMNQLLTHQY